jgi:uncharacterized membrane protein YeaQ/YmgE (transglycosylase-associated protein family)
METCTPVTKTGGEVMSIFIWASLGLVVGLVANTLISHPDGDYSLNMILGMSGAIDGGFMLNILGIDGVAGHTVYVLLLAAFCAAVLIFVCNILIFGGSFAKPMKFKAQGKV